MTRQSLKLGKIMTNQVANMFGHVRWLSIIATPGTDDKKPKISRIKAKVIYFEASNYEKKSKVLNFQKIFQFSYLNNSLQEHFNPIKLSIFWKYKCKAIWKQQNASV